MHRLIGRFVGVGVLALLSPTLVTAQVAERLIYSVSRTPEPLFETPRAAEVITIDDIWRKNARTLPELLMAEAGIFVQQTNYGGGSPIIRGLIGHHILILVDGVRINNGTFRSGPLQYLNTIDLNSVERVEIVRGVGSVLQGALGGIINIITKKGPATGEPAPLGGTVFSRYSSADQGVTGRVEASARTDAYRFLGGVTYRNSDDLEGGEGIGRQPASGYGELAGNFRAEYYVGELSTLSAAYLFMEQHDVGRTDRLVSGRSLVFDFDPQRLQQATVSFQDLADRRWLDFLQLTAQWNKQDEGQLEVQTSAPNVERRFSDSQTLVELALELGTFIGDEHRLLYGVDFGTEDITSTREDFNTVTGVSRSRRGRWTDGASFRSLAVYLQDRIRLRQAATLTVGGRFNSVWVDGEENTAVGRLDLHTTASDFTGLVNLVVHATPTLNLIANVSRGFRAPNIDDVSKFDERSNGTEVPNTNISAERALTYEAGIKYSSQRFAGSAFYHVNNLADLVQRSSGTYNGLSFFDLNGNGVRDAREPNVLQRQNIGEATIVGVEVAAQAVPHPRLTLHGNFTYTRGDDDTGDVPLLRIPPAFGTLGVRWAAASRARPWIEAVSNLAGAQRRLSPDDVSDERIGPGGTDGFVVLNLRGGVSLRDDLRASLALENLTNEAYKYHGSGIFRPGFQVTVGVEYRFGTARTPEREEN